MSALAIDKIGAAEPAKMSEDEPGAEATLIGGMVCASVDVGANAAFTE